MNKPVYYKDLFAGHRKYTEKQLGRKGLSLARLVANQVPVPPFFIIQPDLFTSIVSRIFQDTEISSLSDFRKKVINTPFPPQMAQLIEAEYQKLSGFGKAWISIRSSIVSPDHQQAHFSGLMHSLLNVRGTKDIEEGIKSVFTSLFEDRAYDYLKKKKISYGDVKSAVIVQKMVQSEISGIMYTYDPITLEKDHVSIEAVFGLGDVLADGSLNPDIYTVSKDTLEIIEKKIVPQDWMKVRKVGESESLEHLQKVSISKIWQYSQKLDDALIRELTQLADKVEKALEGPQIIEWVMERGHLYVLQAKAVKRTSLLGNSNVKELSHKVTTMTDIDSFSEIVDEVSITTTTKKPKRKEEISLPPETLLFTGSGASSGVVYGEVIVIPSSEQMSESALERLKTKVTKNNIIATDEFTSDLEQIFLQAGGIVTNFGGINSDAAQTARELHLPAVVGTRIATSFLQNGFMVKIDGASGAVYRVDFIPDKLPEKIDSSFKPEEIQEMKNTPENKNETKTKKSKSEHAIKLFLTNSTLSTDAYVSSLKVSNGTYQEASTIIVPISANVTKTEASRIQKLKKNTKAVILILVSGIKSLDDLISTKRALATHKIKRARRTKIIVGIHSIYGLLNVKGLTEMAVDGILYQIPALSQAYLPDSEELGEKFWKLIIDNLDTVKSAKFSFVGLELTKDYFTVPIRKELKPVIKKGIGALVFTEQMDHVKEEDIAEIEEEVEGFQLE